MPKLSVIVRTFNRPCLLERALGGIFQQTVAADEIIIINNGGASLSKRLEEGRMHAFFRPVPDEGSKPPLVRLIELPTPVSLGAAANEGLRTASGSWVAFHDDDDIWPVTHVEETLNFLRSAPEDLGLLGSSVDQVNEKLTATGWVCGSAELERFPLLNGLEEGPLPVSRIIQHNLLPPIALWYRREALLSAGGYAENVPVLEDWVANRAVLLRSLGWFRKGTPVEYRVRVSPPEGSFGNTITQRREAHRQTAIFLQERWLREELSGGIFGPECFARLQRQMAEQSARLDLIQRLKSGIKRRFFSIGQGREPSPSKG